MGNSNTKESRSTDQSTTRAPQTYHDPATVAGSFAGNQPASRTRNRVSRADLNLFGLTAVGSSTAQAEQPFERRETKAEREARRLERERVARLKERERSMREESVDGGFLVTLGTYTGPEDFNKQVVRQLQIERRIAPFWRGLNDFSETWTEYQLVAAARGLHMPAADEQPPPELIPRARSPDSPHGSTQNLNSLTVPLGPRSMSAASDRSTSILGSALSSPISLNLPRTSSPFKPRAKALAAALSVGSRNASQTDITPREISLPHETFVNGQPLETFLYKEASECPICFLYYPPYLNKTRCCDQPICSECFVQIKRPDPHLPEHHGDQNEGSATSNPEDAADQLISEPATCPYCQQSEFGVTYEPPPFRRGLSYSSTAFGSMSTAMSSQSSLNSATLSPASPSSGVRRRTQSLSANAPNVITTDRVRPDWATKLAAQRAHQARRAAAATALHTAAFLIGTNDSRAFAFARAGRFSRRSTLLASPGGSTAEEVNDGDASGGVEVGARSTSARGLILPRRNRMEELEEMMVMEAVRLSLASEEDRRRKAEKEAKKEAKKREKEERKALKQQQRSGDVYSSGQTSASGSSLSLGLGRRRGNSGTSNLRVEATLQSAMASTVTAPSSEPATPDTSNDKGKGVDRGPAELTVETASGGSSTVGSLPIPTPTTQRGPSHLRQMSNASSISSSLADTPAGSYSGHGALDGSLGSAGIHPGAAEDGDRDPGSAGNEPMFNFRSLAEMVGVQIEGENAGQAKADSPQSETQRAVSPDEQPSPLSKTGDAESSTETIPEEPVEESVATLMPPEAVSQGSTSSTLSPELSPPELTITPETPAPVTHQDGESKQLGHESVVDRHSAITQ